MKTRSRPAALAAATLLAMTFAPSTAWPQVTTDVMREILRERKLPLEFLKGLEQELAIPQSWVAGAKKEGTVTVSMTMEEENFEKLKKAFTARYPYIKLEYSRGIGARRALMPLLAFQRKTYIADVVTSIEVLKAEYVKSDALVKIAGVLPAIKSIDPAFVDNDGLAAAYRLTNYCIGYSTKRVKKEELPKTWDELLTNPRWRNGKVGMAGNANVWLAELWVLKGEAWGQDYMRRIFSDLKPQMRKENLSTIGRLAAMGEYDLAIPTSDAITHRNVSDGIAVGYHCPDIVPVSASNVAILKGNPHPNASFIFANWLLSKEGQIAINYADAMTPANTGLARKELLFYPEEVLGRPKAPLTDKVSAAMPQIMSMWQSYWMKAGGPDEDDKKGGKKGGPR